MERAAVILAGVVLWAVTLTLNTFCWGAVLWADPLNRVHRRLVLHGNFWTGVVLSVALGWTVAKYLRGG